MYQNTWKIQQIGNPNNTHKKENHAQKKFFTCGELCPHKTCKLSFPAFGHQCKRCNKQNHFENKCRSNIKNIFNGSIIGCLTEFQIDF